MLLAWVCQMDEESRIVNPWSANGSWDDTDSLSTARKTSGAVLRGQLHVKLNTAFVVLFNCARACRMWTLDAGVEARATALAGACRSDLHLPVAQRNKNGRDGQVLLPT